MEVSCGQKRETVSTGRSLHKMFPSVEAIRWSKMTLVASAKEVQQGLELMYKEGVDICQKVKAI